MQERKRLDQVADQFSGVNEIVNRDEIEAGPEFGKEVILCYSSEKEQVNGDNREHVRKNFMNP